MGPTSGRPEVGPSGRPEVRPVEDWGVPNRDQTRETIWVSPVLDGDLRCAQTATDLNRDPGAIFVHCIRIRCVVVDNSIHEIDSTRYM